MSYRRLCLMIVCTIYFSTFTGVESFRKTVSGVLTHDGPFKFDGNSTIRVELQDTSLMDTVAPVITGTMIMGVSSFPVSYQLEFDSSQVIQGNRYSISARITRADGILLYVNDVYIPVDVLGQGQSIVNVPLIRVQYPDQNQPAPPYQNNGCPPMFCRNSKPLCPYGFLIENGCEICKCYDPCNPPGRRLSCGQNRQCFVVKRFDGEFEPRCGDKSVRIQPTFSKRNSQKLAICGLPKTVGICRAIVSKFFFNPETNACEEFSYGGCEGNENNFESKQECEKFCKI